MVLCHSSVSPCSSSCESEAEILIFHTFYKRQGLERRQLSPPLLRNTCQRSSLPDTCSKSPSQVTQRRPLCGAHVLRSPKKSASVLSPLSALPLVIERDTLWVILLWPQRKEQLSQFFQCREHIISSSWWPGKLLSWLLSHRWPLGLVGVGSTMVALLKIWSTCHFFPIAFVYLVITRGQQYHSHWPSCGRLVEWVMNEVTHYPGIRELNALLSTIGQLTS